MEDKGNFDADPQASTSFNSTFDFDVFVREFLTEIPIFIAKIGWPVLFTVFFLYMIWPYIQETRRNVSLSSANNVQRKKVLDAEVKRVRAMQQLDLLKSNRDNTDENDESEKTQEEEEAESS